MEQAPQLNQPERPPLSLDLSGPDGNVFAVIGLAHAQLAGGAQELFMAAIREATEPGAGKRYEDILGIVNAYTRLVDTSGLYPAYSEPRE